jgi:nucleotide-binding universal stress UspA family protein
MTKLLVPLDGSALSEAALPWAERLARDLHAQIGLCRVVPPPEAQLGKFQAWGPVVAPAADWMEEDLIAREARDYLEAVARRLGPVGSVPTFVRAGAPAVEVAQLASEWQADLIVMSTHGRGAVGKMVLGSVADGVVRSAGVPVVLVRPQPSETRSQKVAHSA